MHAPGGIVFQLLFPYEINYEDKLFRILWPRTQLIMLHMKTSVVRHGYCVIVHINQLIADDCVTKEMEGDGHH